MNGPVMNFSTIGIVANDPEIKEVGTSKRAIILLGAFPTVEKYTADRDLVRIELSLAGDIQAPTKGTPIYIMSGTHQIRKVTFKNEESGEDEERRYHNFYATVWRIMKVGAPAHAEDEVESPKPSKSTASAATEPEQPATVPADDEDEDDIPF